MKFGKNDEAVSPVIGVILMVAITVILAAVIAAFVFGMGPPTKAPQAQLKFYATTSYLKISHDGGDSLVLKDEKITIKSATTDTALSTTLSGGGVTYTTLTQLPIYDTASGVPIFTTTATLAAGSYIQTPWSGGVGVGLGATAPSKGDILTVQILDTPSGQLIASTKVTVT